MNPFKLRLRKLHAFVMFMLMFAMLICMVGPGCATTKTTTITQTTNTAGAVVDTTNVVTSVNQAILAVDCAGVQSGVQLAVAFAVGKDPSAIPVLQNIQTALSGILNGASSGSVTQIATLLKSQSNTNLVTALGPVVNGLSSLEQNLLQKYGSTVSGEITVAVATAISKGITAAGVQ